MIDPQLAEQHAISFLSDTVGLKWNVDDVNCNRIIDRQGRF